MKGKGILILGLARSGTNLARYLLSRGEPVLAHDDDPEVWSRGEVAELKAQGMSAWDGQPAGLTLAVASPGIPETAPVIRKLRSAKVRIIDEIEFGYEVVGKKIVAVTGTNGKSTTTTLIGEILKTDGRDSFYGGNLVPGRPFAAALLEPPKELYVLEVSSFQLERCEKFAPRVGVLLNVTPDHLNRHESLDQYRDLKLKLFRNQTPGDFAVLNRDDPAVWDARPEKPEVLSFSLADPLADALARDGKLWFRGEPVLPVAELRLPGRHNLANALAAVAATRVLGVKNESIVKVLTTFPGLEHRLELVLEAGGVRYINNSMCTNPAAAIQSLHAFDAPVILITGGREKDLPIDDYVSAITKKARAAILVGENRQRLLERLRALGYRAARVAESLADALKQARDLSRAGDVVLFSPGFASFDQYRDFQERGKAFKDAVRENLE